jgi:hypothetical protein
MIFERNIQMTLLMFGNERNFCIQIYVDVDKRNENVNVFPFYRYWPHDTDRCL